jgi:signal transduction histidine kinase
MRGEWSSGGSWAESRGWRPGPARLIWGLGCLFGLFFLVTLSAFVLMVWLLGSAFGMFGPPGGAPIGLHLPLIGFVILILGFLFLLRVGTGMRRMAEPLDDLADAVRRVEGGDYSVRVDERRRSPRPIRALVRGFNTMAARLETDERQRRSLLADVSHELRTPLSVVQGNLEAIVDGVHPADEGHLSTILDETQVLGRLIDDLRTLALSESGTLALHRETTDFDVLVSEAVEGFRTAAEEAGVKLTTAVPSDLPLLDVDPVRMREVLQNLISNALRYTPRGGGVRVSAGAEPQRGVVRVAVTDTGSGIPEDVLPHVFDRFVKSAESRGSGLGLAIARNLVRAHGGEIGAESRSGQGTTIWFELPIGSASG